MVYNYHMTTKTERLNIRLTPNQDAVVRRAAEARGESTSEYVLRHAVAAAEMDLADRRVFIVGDIEWVALQSLLSAPPSPPERIVKLLTEPSALEIDQG